MARLISGYWVAFARSGDPNGGGRPPWPQHRPGSGALMDFSNQGPRFAPDPVRARLDLWEAVWAERRADRR